MTAIDASESFTVFARDVEPRLRYALTASLGQDLGHEAAAEALAYGWEHWDRVRSLSNPVGYLYRVGRHSVKFRPHNVAFDPVDSTRIPDVEPHLPEVMARLSEKQRVAVFLAYGMGWTRTEVGELLGISANSVGAHISRGLAKLRSGLGVTIDD
jgi:DNA-directed RNA polymerase specialized sigma24 family protein